MESNKPNVGSNEFTKLGLLQIIFQVEEHVILLRELLKIPEKYELTRRKVFY